MVDSNVSAERRGSVSPGFWFGRRVFLTGHTGFKGAWASLLLRRLGAVVTGYALPPQRSDDLFEVARVSADVADVAADIRDLASLQAAMAAANPEIVIHMAAQALVRLSYDEPVDTYAVNVMGTVNLLEAARRIPGISAIVVVTSDKCYENRDWDWGYRENEAMGGYDPYSSSKGCAELVASSYGRSFFSQGPCRVATARAGNVIGGGDWSKDRLVPDAMKAFARGETLRIRSPAAIRPWQHVLEPVSAYLVLAQHLAGGGVGSGEGWNFGPHAESELPVGTMVRGLADCWGEDAAWAADPGPHLHEASSLKLDCSKARARLGWTPRTTVDDAIRMSVEWYRAHRDGADMREVTLDQIDRFLGLAQA